MLAKQVIFLLLSMCGGLVTKPATENNRGRNSIWFQCPFSSLFIASKLKKVLKNVCHRTSREQYRDTREQQRSPTSSPISLDIDKQMLLESSKPEVSDLYTPGAVLKELCFGRRKRPFRPPPILVWVEVQNIERVYKWTQLNIDIVTERESLNWGEVRVDGWVTKHRTFPTGDQCSIPVSNMVFLLNPWSFHNINCVFIIGAMTTVTIRKYLL